MNTVLAIDKAEFTRLAPQLSEFEAFERKANSSSPPWLRALRTCGISHFAEMGFPTKECEEWRFTNPAPLVEFGFRRAAQLKLGGSFDPSAASFSGLRSHRLVFVDGHYSPELSTLLPHPAGVMMGSLDQAIQARPDLLEGHLGRHLPAQSCPFAALNTAFIEDGAFVYVPSGVVLEEPVHCLFLSSQAGVVSQPRILIVASSGSRVGIIEDYLSLGEQPGLVNAVTELYAGENSQIEHLKLQRLNQSSLHVGNLEAEQMSNSRVLSHSISLGGRLARNRIALRFEGEGCDSVMNGLYLAAGEQLVDHHTLADHARAHCSSHEFYHGILGGRSRGVFNGRIMVRLDAQKTDAKQTNRNLLLSAQATVNTKPQLEIFADDVKCTHGATVGQLDPEAIFYLRSRGIGEAEARQMLVAAFASGILNRITSEPVRQELERLVSRKMHEAGAATGKVPAETQSA